MSGKYWILLLAGAAALVAISVTITVVEAPGEQSPAAISAPAPDQLPRAPAGKRDTVVGDEGPGITGF